MIEFFCFFEVKVSFFDGLVDEKFFEGVSFLLFGEADEVGQEAIVRVDEESDDFPVGREEVVADDKSEDLCFGSDEFSTDDSEVLADFDHFGEVKVSDDLKLQMGHVQVVGQVLEVVEQLENHPPEPLSISVNVHIVEGYVLDDFVVREFERAGGAERGGDGVVFGVVFVESPDRNVEELGLVGFRGEVDFGVDSGVVFEDEDGFVCKVFVCGDVFDDVDTELIFELSFGGLLLFSQHFQIKDLVLVGLWLNVCKYL